MFVVYVCKQSGPAGWPPGWLAAAPWAARLPGYPAARLRRLRGCAAARLLGWAAAELDGLRAGVGQVVDLRAQST